MGTGDPGEARWRRTRALFERLIELPAARRAEELRSACGDDGELRAELEALLAAADHEGDGADFLRPPGAGERVGDFLLGEVLERGTDHELRLAEHGPGACAHVALAPLAARDVGTLRRLSALDRALSRLVHPGLASWLQSGVCLRGTPPRPWLYVAWEHVAASSPLFAHAREQDLDRGGRRQLLARVCEALAFLHAHGAAHGDPLPRHVRVEPGGGVRLSATGLADLRSSDGEQATEERDLAVLSSWMPAFLDGAPEPERRMETPRPAGGWPGAAALARELVGP